MTVRRWRSIAATIGSGGPPASMRTALPPGRSPTTYELESQPGSMLRSRITARSLAIRENDRVLDDPAHIAEDIELLERLRGVLRSAPRHPGEQRLRRGARAAPHRRARLEASSRGAAGSSASASSGRPGRTSTTRRSRCSRTTSSAAPEALDGPARLPQCAARARALGEPRGVRRPRRGRRRCAATSCTTRPSRGRRRTIASLRLHRGALADGALGDAPFALERTLFLDFATTPPGREVRTSGSSGCRPGGA